MQNDPQFDEEKKFRDDFNRIMTNDQSEHATFGYPVKETAEERESLDQFYSQEELENVVKELLRNSHRLDASDISVVAHGRVITLSGTVKSQEERDCALSIARLVNGIMEVRSEIIVKTHEGILPTDLGRQEH